MNKKNVIVGLLLIGGSLIAQVGNDEYNDLVNKGRSLYNEKKFKEAALSYSDAFKAIGWKGTSNDHYNAACCWALASVPDSALSNLERIATKSNFSNYDHIIKDTDFSILHNDKRWNSIIELIKINRDSAEAKLNRPLMNQLIEIHNIDQNSRNKQLEIAGKYGWDSKEISKFNEQQKPLDSINLVKVEQILNKYGWLGQDVIGGIGNSTLWLVIQHADLKTQEKYLPMMRVAVKEGKAEGSTLAMLEDRIEIRNGRKQIYGSQIGRDENNKYFVSPLLDPDNVDRRRASVGLSSLSEYVKNWDMLWDIEQYKKDLPHLIEIQKKY